MRKCCYVVVLAVIKASRKNPFLMRCILVFERRVPPSNFKQDTGTA